jgi:phospholipid-binding lipoprotein MlaA
MQGYVIRAVGRLVVILALLAPGAAARAALAPQLVAEIERAALEAAYLVQNDTAAVAGLNNPELVAIMSQRAHERAADAMSAVIVGAVARNPAQAAEIVAAASAAAPQYRDRFAYDVAKAFPGLAGGYPAGAVQYVVPSYDSYGTGNYGTAVYAPAPAYTQTPVYSTAPVYAAAEAEPARISGPEPIDDPFEGFNRGVFFVNDQLDTYLLRPIAWAYGWVTPEPVKAAIRRAFLNLRSPARFANDLLQLEIADAGTTGARFLINSSIGVAGLFDVAAELGHPHHPADFGQTMYAYGTGAGPYLVIPLLGPTTARDGTGRVVDLAFHPFSYLLDTVPEGLLLVAGDGIVRREDLIVVLDGVKATSVDYYAGVRALYYQDRAIELNRGQAADSSVFDDEFAAFE